MSSFDYKGFLGDVFAHGKAVFKAFGYGEKVVDKLVIPGLAFVDGQEIIELSAAEIGDFNNLLDGTYNGMLFRASVFVYAGPHGGEIGTSLSYIGPGRDVQNALDLSYLLDYENTDWEAVQDAVNHNSNFGTIVLEREFLLFASLSENGNEVIVEDFTNIESMRKASEIKAKILGGKVVLQFNDELKASLERFHSVNSHYLSTIDQRNKLSHDKIAIGMAESRSRLMDAARRVVDQIRDLEKAAERAQVNAMLSSVISLGVESVFSENSNDQHIGELQRNYDALSRRHDELKRTVNRQNDLLRKMIDYLTDGAGAVKVQPTSDFTGDALQPNPYGKKIIVHPEFHESVPPKK